MQFFIEPVAFPTDPITVESITRVHRRIKRFYQIEKRIQRFTDILFGEQMTTFKFNNVDYTIKLTYGLSINVLPDKFGINLTKIFVDNDLASQTMNTLVLDDERTLGLMWFFVEPTAAMDYDTFLNKVHPQEVEDFREAFWAEVVNFSGSLKKNILIQMWSEFKKELKSAHLTKEQLEA